MENEVTEERERVSKIRQREEEEYQYNLKRKRQLEDDEWEDSKKARESVIASKEEDLVNKAKDVLNNIDGVIIFVPIVIAIILLLINIKQISSGIRFLAISILASGAIGLIIEIFIKSKINISNILIINDSFSEVVKNVINNILNNINMMSITAIVASLVLIILTNIIKVNSKTIE